MPEISLLQPAVLRETVERLTAPESLILLNSMRRTPWPYPVAEWDVIVGSRAVAKPNVPNSEAHIVPHLARSHESAAFIYLREKKVFSPTTLYWLRTDGDLAARNAEREVLREITDLNQRFDNFMEWVAWQTLKGQVVLDFPDVQTTIDTKIPASHKPSPATAWGSATPTQIRDDVLAWKRLGRRDGRVEMTTAYATELTINRIMAAFQDAPEHLSDRMKDEFWRSGIIPGFLGLDWTTVESVYDDDQGNRQMFLDDDELILANLTTNDPLELIEGPTADFSAPRNFTGKFSKTFREEDPSAEQFLLEWHALPVLTRPEQVVYVADVNS